MHAPPSAKRDQRKSRPRAAAPFADPLWAKALARERLRRHPHFRAHDRDVRIDLTDGNLVLTGRLPSFYLKQLLQNTLRGLPGVAQIENRVDVVRWDGLSSEPAPPRE